MDTDKIVIAYKDKKICNESGQVWSDGKNFILGKS